MSGDIHMANETKQNRNKQNYKNVRKSCLINTVSSAMARILCN
jgi:hypothetical protein